MVCRSPQRGHPWAGKTGARSPCTCSVRWEHAVRCERRTPSEPARRLWQPSHSHCDADHRRNSEGRVHRERGRLCGFGFVIREALVSANSPTPTCLRLLRAATHRSGAEFLLPAIRRPLVCEKPLITAGRRETDVVRLHTYIPWIDGDLTDRRSRRIRASPTPSAFVPRTS
jgi:hypothetical protein